MYESSEKLNGCFHKCMYFVFNSWYLLTFLSISILTTISLFIWTLVVTVVSNRHRYHTLTAGSVVLVVVLYSICLISVR